MKEDTDVSIKLGKMVKFLRLKNGLTIRQLSMKSKICERALRKIECGKGNPLCSTLIKLAMSFNITASQLVKDL